MNKILIVGVVILAFAATAFVGYRAGWFAGVLPGADQRAPAANLTPGAATQPASVMSGVTARSPTALAAPAAVAVAQPGQPIANKARSRIERRG